MWSEGGTLKNRYPRIYALESSKLITVGMKVAQPSLTFSFRRAPRGGVEQEQFDEIVALVNDVILAPISDRWTWTLVSSEIFPMAIDPPARCSASRPLALFAPISNSLVGRSLYGVRIIRWLVGLAGEFAFTV
ncbi:hypothetical protein Tco_1474239 [Tanacetum coccineum]